MLVDGSRLEWGQSGLSVDVDKGDYAGQEI